MPSLRLRDTGESPQTLTIGITLGDPRGIGAEITSAALLRLRPFGRTRFIVVGPENALSPKLLLESGVELESTGAWSAADATDESAGILAARAIERAIALAREGRIDGLVTAPISKAALAAAGYRFPGHTEFLRERTGVPEVVMMMAAETTPLGGALRLAVLTGHIPLRDVPVTLTPELVVTRSRIAVAALRDWWGIEAPRVALAGVNPHASEGGRFGDEEERVLQPAAERLREDGVEVTGIFPGDTVYRQCIEGRVDLVLVPYHDVGLAVLKTLASEQGVNVTAGLPFPRTSPDHGTAFDIAGQGRANPQSMTAAIEMCVRFCSRAQAGTPARVLG